MSSSTASLADSISFSSGSEPEESPPPPPTATATAAQTSPPNQQRQRPAQPPRLPSPRLFRDFFNAMSDTASRRQATLPRTNYQDPVHDVNRALQSANRALQTAQEAFHQARRLRAASGPQPEANSQPVDLTSSPPDRSAEARFFSQTTHPHDSASNSQRSRRFNALDEPVYGPPPNIPLLNPSDPLTLVRLWPVSAPNPPRLPHPDQTVRLQSMVDEEAINRQRENHTNWERTQARNQQRLQNPASTAMSPPSSSASSSKTTRPRPLGPSAALNPAIESVDLTGVDDNATLSAALAKQRQDAILSQNTGNESGRTPLTAYKCPVCMDTPTDATSTACGHVFCHRCIMDTLNWSVEQRREGAPPNRKVKGVCPVCRKQLDVKDTPGTGRSLIPLELKLMVRKRKRDDKGKAKMFKAETLSDDDDDEGRDDRLGSGKENVRAGKARKRESTEEALWGQFMAD
ncbi:hypothetical protein A1O1_08874 [Capronia coronata CBS 617.96]|uniref:RING-type domain-containing protein n=1 Tax=Capronia coronata CBS 617.96 TaxID=1182541 RepID=W9Y7V5_9EURO|nr:uncharacterized protein A1O1_08874 [Capronia coronata CBS 617.96]EXJ78474.1 hypothetical protein A1O1_08874 [Capronia coronata CBS 617.96]